MPRDTVRIALVQQHAGKEQPENVARGVEAVQRAAARGARVVVFGELAFTRFFPQQRPAKDPLDLAEPIPGPTTERFCDLARHLGVVIVLNLYERQGNLAFDSSPVIDADGTLLGCTRMVHIPEYENCYERDYYTPGDQGAGAYTTAAGRLGVAICYDRHFPEYMRALALSGAELVVVPQAGSVAEWPPGLFEAEMQVAAFQNGYFCALCNRVGPETHLTFAGESFVCGPTGAVLARAPAAKDHLLLADLDLSEVARSPARQLFLRDRRPEIYGPWLGRT